MWDLPGPGIEPVSPALAGGLLTTEPPGKSQHITFKNRIRDMRNQETHDLVSDTHETICKERWTLSA